MPNLDGGHYYYTGLFPIRLDPVKRADGSITVPSHLVRETLASLPNFSQIREVDDAARKTDRISPFARCRSTHFVRLAVIDDPTFNGRDPSNALIDILKGLVGKRVDLAVHQPVDYLSCAWLMFTADFDAVDMLSRDRWAAGLWQLMEKELREIFGHCEQFEHVDSPETFASYLDQGQVETTMSFNDYWIDPMPGKPLSPVMLLAAIGVVTAVVVGLTAFLLRYVHVGWRVWAVSVLIGIVAGAFVAYKWVMARGAKPFPTPPNSDLKSVLKGLYLQQHFTRFAIRQQGASPEQLHAAFGKFIAEVLPGNVEGPTQPPGVLRS